MTDVGISPPGEPARGEENAVAQADGGMSRRRFGRGRNAGGPHAYRPLAAAVGLAIAVGSVAAAAGLHGRLGLGFGAGSGADTPPARSGAAMAFDADHGVVVMFGGVDQNRRSLGDTWTWDGSRWTQQHPRTSPPPRQKGAMVWDAARHRIVLAGGVDLTWSFAQVPMTSQGSVSTHAGVAGPPAHVSIDMTPAPMYGVVKPVEPSCPAPTGVANHGRSVVVQCVQVTPCRPAGTSPPAPSPPAGCVGPCPPPASCAAVPQPVDNGPLLDDTWTWDGTDWTEQHPAHHPQGRLAAAFDGASGRVVAVGLDSVSAYLGAPAPEMVPTCPRVAPSDAAGPGATGAACATGTVACGVVLGSPAGGHPAIPEPAACGAPVAVGDTTLGRTWLWDGRDWTAQPSAVGPGTSSLLSTDPASGRAMAVRFSDPCPAIQGAASGSSSGGTTGAGGGGASPPQGPARPASTSTVAPMVATPPGWSPPMPCTILEPGAPRPSLPPAARTVVVAPPAQLLVWTGSTWQAGGRKGPASLPTGELVADGFDRTLLLFNGSETWVGSPTGWTQRGGVGLPPRTGAAMAYDAARHSVVLFGGQVSGRTASGSLVSVALDDTWTWDGTRWAKRDGGPVPSLRPLVGRPLSTAGNTTVTLLPAPAPPGITLPPVPRLVPPRSDCVTGGTPPEPTPCPSSGVAPPSSTSPPPPG